MSKEGKKWQLARLLDFWIILEFFEFELAFKRLYECCYINKARAHIRHLGTLSNSKA